MKKLLLLAALATFAVLYLFNAVRGPSSQWTGGGTEGSSATNPSGEDKGKGIFIEVETPSGIERLRAERITFVILSTGNLAYDANLSVSGYLFGQTEEVEISLFDASGKQVVEIGKALTDNAGNLPTYAFNIPKNVTPGKHVVRVEGQSSGRKAEASFVLRAGNPWVNPSTYSGKPQSTVDLSGGGYLPGEIVSVHFDSLAYDPIGVGTSDGQGAFDATVPVPVTGEGSHAFIIVGDRTNSPVRIPFSVLGFQPWVSLSNYAPQPNQAMGFSGHDFVPGEEVRVYFNQLGPEAVAVARADEEGNFDIQDVFFPPPEGVGENTFLFVGNMSQTVVQAAFEVLPLTPGLELTVYAGLPGTQVSFIGQGFFPSETLRAYLGKPESGKEVSVFEAGANGGFEEAGTFSIPFADRGSSVAISVVGDRSRTPAAVTFSILPYSPWTNLSAYFGPPGTEIVIDGGGFAPEEGVTIHFQNRQSPSLLRVQTGPDGSFQRAGPVTIPSVGGESVPVVLIGEKSGAEVVGQFSIRRLDQTPKDEAPPPANESPSQQPTTLVPPGVPPTAESTGETVGVQ